MSNLADGYTLRVKETNLMKKTRKIHTFSSRNEYTQYDIFYYIYCIVKKTRDNGPATNN